MIARRSYFTAATLAWIVVVGGAPYALNAQHTHPSRGPRVEIRPSRPGSRPAPKPVAFDPKSKLEVAYTKIIEGKDQTFEERLQAAVVMERWENVDKILSELDPVSRREVAIKTLGDAGAKIAVPMRAIISILEDCPGPMTASQRGRLFVTVKKTLGAYGGKDLLIKAINKGFLGLGGSEYQGKKAAFEILMGLELYDEARKFLITTQDAKKAEKDHVVLQHFNALEAKCQKVGRVADYVRLRTMGQWLLDRNKLSAKEMADVAEKITPTLGFIDESEAITWFKDNFEKGPRQEKRTVLACTDYLSKTRNSRNPALRDAGLRLQKRMVDALIKVNGLKDRGPVADILAEYWLGEAKRGERKVEEENRHEQRYRYYRYRGQQMPPVKYSDPGAPSMEVLGETTPSGVWVEKLRPESFLKLQEYRSNIYVNTGQYDAAMAVVRKVADIAPGKAVSMAETLLRKWSQKANPNAGVSDNRSYAGLRGIPLTRTKQLRNMRQLKKMVGEFRSYLASEMKETILVNAFANAHSAAEVYKLSDIEAVLGNPAKLSLDAVWMLASDMRQKLSNSWNKQELQKALATKRTKRELEDLLVGGYDTLATFMERGIEGREFPTRLYALQGVILFEYFEFKYNLDRNEKDKIKACFKIRDKAFECFDKSVENYAKYLKANPDAAYTTQIHEIWFDAITNASSTNTLEGKSGIGTGQLDAIKKSFSVLPEKTVQAHRDMFAKKLLAKAMAAPGDKKIAFMEAGLHIAQDTPLTEDFQRYLDYYQELLTEVKLMVRLDGGTRVGTAPFGMYLSLIHTTELSRESGGFSQYLNPQMRHPFNSRAPGFNPVKNLNDNIAEALAANFEVLEVTFSPASVKARTFDVTKWTGEELMAGRWQETPLAYVTLKAKDEAVDSIPSLHMDLHFIDLNSGVSIPVRSRVIHGIKATESVSRPCPGLKITQLLDQRNLSKDGKISLEIKASANGVIPELDKIVKVPDLDSFERTIPKGDLQVRALKSEERVLPEVERVWTITYKLEDRRTEMLPKEFLFPTLVIADAELENKVYDDANLETVDGAVALVWGEEKPFDYAKWLVVVAALAVVAAVLIMSKFLGKSEEAVAQRPFSMPDSVTPFSVIKLLEDIHANARLDEESRKAIKADVKTLEKSFFSPASGSEENASLRGIADKWISKVQ